MFVCQVIIFIGRGTYYRFYRKERDLSLEQQEYIRRIFVRKEYRRNLHPIPTQKNIFMIIICHLQQFRCI
ncbi:DUF6078 family protein [Bacteroides sp. AN502(2024)]|uniref:DUF6078 family protein n=1 Tax=Bacteroides sp. AN502(2024) TaxID=3160599 RepID=UPI003517172B